MNRGEVHGLVAVADAGRTVAEVDDRDRVVAPQPGRQGGADGLRDLCAHHVGEIDHFQLGVGAVGRELARAAKRLAVPGHEPAHDLRRRHPESHQHGEVAVVDVEPVVAPAQRPDRAELSGLVALRRRHDRRLALTVQQPDALVQCPAAHHDAVHLQEPLLAQTGACGSGCGVRLSSVHRVPQYVLPSSGSEITLVRSHRASSISETQARTRCRRLPYRTPSAGRDRLRDEDERRAPSPAQMAVRQTVRRALMSRSASWQ